MKIGDKVLCKKSLMKMKSGDYVVCVDNKERKYFTLNKKYKIIDTVLSDYIATYAIQIKDDDSNYRWVAWNFCFKTMQEYRKEKLEKLYVKAYKNE